MKLKEMKSKKNDDDLTFYDQGASPKSVPLPESTDYLFHKPENTTDFPDPPEYWSVCHDMSIIRLHFTPKYPTDKSVMEKFLFFFDPPTVQMKFRGKKIGRKYFKEDRREELYCEIAKELTKAGSVLECQKLVERSHQRILKYFHSKEMSRNIWREFLIDITSSIIVADFYSPEQKDKLKELLVFWSKQGLDMSKELKSLDEPPKSMAFWKQQERDY